MTMADAPVRAGDARDRGAVADHAHAAHGQVALRRVVVEERDGQVRAARLVEHRVHGALAPLAGAEDDRGVRGRGSAVRRRWSIGLAHGVPDAAHRDERDDPGAEHAADGRRPDAGVEHVEDDERARRRAPRRAASAATSSNEPSIHQPR